MRGAQPNLPVMVQFESALVAFGSQDSYQRLIDTKAQIVNGQALYIIHCQFQKALINVALAFDQTGLMTVFLITPLSALPKKEIEHRAIVIASEFFQKRFDEVFGEFNADLKGQSQEDRLRDIWTQATNGSGAFDHVMSGVKNGDLDVVDVLCQMQGGKKIVRVGYDLDIKISGFWVLPASN